MLFDVVNIFGVNRTVNIDLRVLRIVSNIELSLTEGTINLCILYIATHAYHKYSIEQQSMDWIATYDEKITCLITMLSQQDSTS